MNEPSVFIVRIAVNPDKYVGPQGPQDTPYKFTSKPEAEDAARQYLNPELIHLTGIFVNAF